MPTEPRFPTSLPIAPGCAAWPPPPAPVQRRSNLVVVVFHGAGLIVTGLAWLWGFAMIGLTAIAMMFGGDGYRVGPNGQSNVGLLFQIVVFATSVPALLAGLAAIGRFQPKGWLTITAATAGSLGALATLVAVCGWS